ncbi:phosphotransferase family protein [Solicola sp. PLA-1-18]|uniref:phosphotransferase family protein n=1 Tax=Solicola sp. PLA-1-18 TaxID=3380532 RepID=UPI003B7EF350
MLSPAARAFVEEATGSPVASVDPLVGGWTSTMLAIACQDGTDVVLRQMTREPWRTHASALLARESWVQGVLATTSVPAPASLALDADGLRTGVPSHLMTRLPGALELRRDDADLVDRLARLLADVHAVVPPERPRAYQSWAGEQKQVVPTWAGRPDAWRSAFAVLEDEPPAAPGVFLHRDLHLGNVLWQGGEVSGVVDWVETSWGPADLDVAHARTYLAMLHGPDVADALARAYDLLRADGGAHGRRYWDVMDVVGHLPDPSKVTAPWRDSGVGVPDEISAARLEEHLVRVLG